MDSTGAAGSWSTGGRRERRGDGRWLCWAVHLLMMLSAWVWAPAGAAHAATLSYGAVVDRLTDLDRIARLPAPAEKTILASSYDRASRYDAQRQQYVNWGANGDSNGVIRYENGEAVLAEAAGPGAIVRMWSAAPGLGHVKIYIDGSTTPVFDMPFYQYFNHASLTGNSPNLFDYPHLAYYTVAAKVPGSNNFVPITFAKSIKIVADPKWGSYYQFTIAQFPSSDRVESASPAVLAANQAILKRADARVAQGPDAFGAGRVQDETVTAAPQSSVTVANLKGRGAVDWMGLKLALPEDADAQKRLLEGVWVKISWDGEDRPSVLAPVADFFGSHAGAESFASFVTGSPSPGQFYANWVMPFTRGARFEIVNMTDEPVDLTWRLQTRPLRAAPTAYGRFHAQWHGDPAQPVPADRRPDWPLLKEDGAGRLVGVHLHVYSPTGRWWGEGDEKFFIDGEKFPSDFGTGTEDFFGYAWGAPGLFSKPFHDQVLNENNAGDVIDNRFMLTDSAPFHTSIDANLEKYFGAPDRTTYDVVVYWYQRPGGA